MRDVAAELKALRLYGMVGAWEEIIGQGLAALESSRWLIEHLLEGGAHRPGHALDQLPDARRQVPGASRPGRLRLRAVQGRSQSDHRTGRSLLHRGGPQRGVHRRTRAPARRIWPRRWASPASPTMANGCASTRPSIWSMLLEQEKAAGKAGRLAFA